MSHISYDSLMPEMRWKVRLEGQEDGLERLTEAFTEDPRIFKEDEQFYLHQAGFNQINHSTKVREEGKDTVRMIRALAEFHSLRVGSLDASPVVKITDDGSEQTLEHLSVSTPNAVGVSDHVSHGSEKSPAKAQSTYEYTQLALTDDSVRELLELRGEGKHWVNLYRMYEHVRSNFEPGDIADEDWWDETEASRFTTTANDPDAIGHEARHASDDGVSVEDMEADAMSHNEARSWIRAITAHWLERRAAIHS